MKRPAGKTKKSPGGTEDPRREKVKWGSAPRPRPHAQADAGPGVRMSDIEAERVRWLWQDFIPIGSITILEGDPDEGKSLLSLDLAARASTGRPMPRGALRRKPRGVVILSAEDGLGNTIRPRLEAAGADLDRIRAFRPAELPMIPNDLGTLEAAIRCVRARLLIIDPLPAFLDQRFDAYKDQDVRQALAPVAAVAGRLGVAVLVIRHLIKTEGGPAKYRGGALGTASRPRPPRPARRRATDTRSDQDQPLPQAAVDCVLNCVG